VYSWGACYTNCDSMVLGLGSDSEDVDYSIPHLITALLGERVRRIATEPEMSCAVADAGALYTLGPK
jgi:hypothetical protein